MTVRRAFSCLISSSSSKLLLLADSSVGDRCAPGGAQLHPKSDVGFEWHLLKLRHCEETRRGNPVGIARLSAVQRGAARSLPD